MHEPRGLRKITIRTCVSVSKTSLGMSKLNARVSYPSTSSHCDHESILSCLDSHNDSLTDAHSQNARVNMRREVLYPNKANASPGLSRPCFPGPRSPLTRVLLSHGLGSVLLLWGLHLLFPLSQTPSSWYNRQFLSCRDPFLFCFFNDIT